MVVAGRVSGVGANVVAVASGRGVVLTLLGAVTGDLLAAKFAEVTGETIAVESVWGPAARGKRGKDVC